MYIPEIPNNTLKPLLEEIVNIARKLDGIERFSFSTPAYEEDINKMEIEIKSKIPEEYKDFLRFSNGATLCSFIADFYDISYVIELNSNEMAEDFPNNYIIIADITGDGEALCFSKETGEFIFYFDGEEEKFDTFYEALSDIISHIKNFAEDYIEL